MRMVRWGSPGEEDGAGIVVGRLDAMRNEGLRGLILKG